ncbi:MAG TPA: hypothetical protein VGD24_03110 [Gallionella sp.]
MQNSIDAHVEFSFRGEDYSLCSTLDLDKLLAQHDSLPSLHAILAREHGIDTYSYLYEVMQEADIEFRNAQGIAADFMSDGEFELNALESNWQNLRILAQLRPIASRTLGITDLDRNEALKSALIQAYKLGCELGSNK